MDDYVQTRQRVQRRSERAWLRNQRRIYRRPVGPLLLCCLAVLLVLLVTACNPMVVTARFPDGSPKSVTEYSGAHADEDTITAFDRSCSLLGICWGWTSPKEHWWHDHWYHDYIGAQGTGYWIVNEGGWHNYLSCELLILDSNYLCLTDWPRYSAETQIAAG